MCTYAARHPCLCPSRMHCYRNPKMKAWGSGVFGSWKQSPHDLMRFRKRTLKATSFFLPCDDTARRGPPTVLKKEHQTDNLIFNFSSSKNVKKKYLLMTIHFIYTLTRSVVKSVEAQRDKICRTVVEIKIFLPHQRTPLCVLCFYL